MLREDFGVILLNDGLAVSELERLLNHVKPIQNDLESLQNHLELPRTTPEPEKIEDHLRRT